MADTIWKCADVTDRNFDESKDTTFFEAARWGFFYKDEIQFSVTAQRDVFTRGERYLIEFMMFEEK
jgi:hypothetical protein